MTSDASNESLTNILIIGLTSKRAELLSSAIDRLEPKRFSFRILEIPLSGMDPHLIGKSVVLAGDEISVGSQPLLTSALRLRTETCFWEPLHLCSRKPPSGIDFAKEWSIYFHSLPPDVRNLVLSLDGAEPVPLSRRTEIVRSSLCLLVDDLSAFIHTLNPGISVDPIRLRTSVGDALLEITATGIDSCKDLVIELTRLSNAASISQTDINEVLPLVIEAELGVRGTGHPERLLSTLHTLNNVLRLAIYEPNDLAEITKRVCFRLRCLKEGGLGVLPVGSQRAAFDSYNRLVDLVRSTTLDAEGNSVFRDELIELRAGLDGLVTLLGVRSNLNSGVGPVKRILVIEDDDDWRRLIIEVLRDMFISGGMEIQEAQTVAEAQSFLESNVPSIVLVDLGLPLATGSEIGPNAGLLLIRQLTQSEVRRSEDRFIILTATEDYAEAVRDVLSFGIAPTNYIQKNAGTWRGELRAQIRLALQPSLVSLPSIEVFKRTGRIARIEGSEIKLDYPQWALLSVLAQGRAGRWHEAKKLANVLYWNYSLNPDSRSAETDKLDPEERILLQLPHYASDLRLRLTEAYSLAVGSRLSSEILSFDDQAGYRLNANAQVLEWVSEHFRPGHRPSVLVVEDNPEWGTQIGQELQLRGFDTRLARWTGEAREMLEARPPDLISLDIELPSTAEAWSRGETDTDGVIDLLRFLRQRELSFPTAILTAIPWRDGVMLRILREGVRIEDYLSKHSDYPIQRLAGSLMRLWQEHLTQTRILDWDPLSPIYPIEIDSDRHILVSVADCLVNPPGKGKEILRVLSATPNIFVSRSELLEAVYGEVDSIEGGPDDAEKALNSHIKRLRKIITDATGGVIAGENVICGDRGIYWLRGLVQ